MLISLLSITALLAVQDPTPGLVNAPAERSEAQAALDVCLYTPAESRDPACQPLLEAEAALVPDHAFALARPTSLGWADTACPTDRFSGAARTACRDEQRGLFRRAERARQALAHGAAGGVYAEAGDRPPAAASGETPGLGFNREEVSEGERCNRRARASQDPDTGDSSSSYSISCAWSTGDEEDRERARQALDAVMGDD